MITYERVREPNWLYSSVGSSLCSDKNSSKEMGGFQSPFASSLDHVSPIWTTVLATDLTAHTQMWRTQPSSSLVEAPQSRLRCPKPTRSSHL